MARRSGKNNSFFGHETFLCAAETRFFWHETFFVQQKPIFLLFDMKLFFVQQKPVFLT